MKEEEYPYDLFVSYTETDSAWVEGYLLEALEQSEIQVISESSFTLGRPRISEFERAIRQSRYILLVISEAYLADDLTEFTDILAQSYGEQTGTWPVIPLTLQEGLQLPPRLKMLEGLKADDSEQWEAALERLCRQLKYSPPPSSPKPACPYPGMIPFNENDGERFFGRDNEIEEVVNKLRLHPFLTLIGPSGSGKSSLVFAGLIPQLKQSGLFGTGGWCIRSFRPGTNPSDNLQTVLGGDTASIELKVQQLLSTQPDAQRFLLIIDQFEELFTQAEAEAVSFQRTILELTALPCVYLILTVRADFYPDLMGSLLWEKIQTHRYEVLPLAEEGLRQAIVRPAERTEVYIDSALVERLLVDAQGEPGVLPLIQETLVLLWEKLERRFLPLSAYELLFLPRPAYGATENQPRTGLQVAIARRADAALADLETDEKRVIARRIFLRLIQFGEGRLDTRRQQSEDKLRSYEDNSKTFGETLEQLAHPSRRLIVLSGGEDGHERKVDIAHEALISGWSTLQDWINELREAEKVRRRLEGKAQEWKRLEEKGGLLDETELVEAESWLNGNDAEILGYEKPLYDLIAASRKAVELKKRQKKKRIVVSFAVLSVFLAVITVLFIVTRLQRNNYRLDALSYSAEKLLDSNKNFDALLVALRAGKELKQSRGIDIDISTKVIATLQQAVYTTQEKNRLEGHAFQVNGVSLSPDGHTIASASDDCTVKIWKFDGTNITTLQQPRHDTDQEDKSKETCRYSSISFNPDPEQKNLAVAAMDGNILLWKTDGTFIRSIKAHDGAVLNINFNHQGTLLASAGKDKKIRLWKMDELTDQEAQPVPITLEGHTESVNSVSFHPDGTQLVSAGADGTIRLWDISTGIDKTPFKGMNTSELGKIVLRVNFSSNGELIASGHQDGFVRIWNVAGEELYSIKAHKDAVHDVVFNQDGDMLASAGKDGKIKIWNIEGSLIKTLHGHTDEVNSLSFNQDNSVLISGSMDNTLRLWSLAEKTQRICPSFAEIFDTVTFNQTGRFIAVTTDMGAAQLCDVKENILDPLKNINDLLYPVETAAPDRNGTHLLIFRTHALTKKPEINLWNIGSGTLIEEPFNYSIKNVEKIAFSPDGLLFATASCDGSVNLWNVNESRANPQKITEHNASATTISFSPDGQQIASGGKDNIIRLRKTTDGAKLADLTGHGDRVNAISFSKDGKVLASASNDSTVRLWSTDGTLLQTLKGHVGGVEGVDIALDGGIIASGGKDGFIRLWSSNGRELKAFHGHNSRILGIKFTEQNSLISVGEDTSIILWNMDLEELLQQGCAWVNDYLQNNLNVTTEEKALCDDVTFN